MEYIRKLAKCFFEEHEEGLGREYSKSTKVLMRESVEEDQAMNSQACNIQYV